MKRATISTERLIDLVEIEALYSRVDKATARLARKVTPQEKAAMFTLAEEGLKPSVIAKRLGRTPDTVKHALRQGRKKQRFIPCGPGESGVTR